MFSLLRRSKNRKTHRQDNENISNNTDISKESQNQVSPQNRVHGKFTTAIDALEDFNDLDGKQKTLQEKQTTSTDEREAYFAKIYFEDAKQKNVNLANRSTSPETLKTANKSVGFTASDSSTGSNLKKSSAAHLLNSATSTSTASTTSTALAVATESTTATTTEKSKAKESKRNSATKKTLTTRRSLGFRQVDLDGINSVIEAIIPDDDDENRERNVHAEQSSRSFSSDSEQANFANRTLSQNERAELSGHVSSQPWPSTSNNYQKICKLEQTESNVSKTFNNYESLLTKSNDTGNVRSRITDQAKESTKTESNTANVEGITLENSKEPLSNIKQIKSARRRSYFLRKNSNENSPDESSANQNQNQNQFENVSEVVQKIDVKKLQGPLQKGKKLLSDIFMARGRNHNQQHQRNRQPLVQQTSSKHGEQKKPCGDKDHAAVSENHNNCQNAISNKDETTINFVRNNFTTANNQIPIGSQIEATTSLAAAANAKAKANAKSKSTESETETETSSTMLRKHLETNNSPRAQRDPAASSQMTLSNNSSKNASFRDVPEVGGGIPQQLRSHVRGSGVQQHQRSNSAEQHREHGAYDHYENIQMSKSERAYSEEPHTVRRRWSEAVEDFGRVPYEKEHTSVASTRSLSDAKLPQENITRLSSVERNGLNSGETVSKLSTTNNADNESKRSSELTACARDYLKFSKNQQKNVEELTNRTTTDPMGQANAKNETSAEQSRASTPRDFRESFIPETDLYDSDTRTKVTVPKITVSDCSSARNIPINTNESPVEHEVFYDFESESSQFKSAKENYNVKNNAAVEIEDFDSDADDDVFHEQVTNSQPTQYTTYRHHSPRRYSPITLEDVPEQEEDEAIIEHTSILNGNDIGNELSRRSRSRHANSASASPERGPLKSSDSNLSNSYPDSGISGCSDSQFSSSESNSKATKSPSQTTLPRRQRSPFARDSTSTDCDDTLLQCDELDCFVSPSTSTTTVISGRGERLVCIESISLPDVVESTTSSPGSANGQNNSTNVSSDAGSAPGEQIININGATGNSMGGVHFIPIHIEGERSRGGSVRDSSPNKQQKRRSIDDSVIGSGIKGARFAQLNGNFELSSKPTIEIIEEDENNGCHMTNSDTGLAAEKLRFELQEQKSRFSAQIDDAQKNVQNLQTKIDKMQTKIVNLEQELSTKTWNVERLQSELNATQLEDELVRQKLRLLEDEKTNLRHKYSENEDEFRKKFEELEVQYKELEEKYKSTQQLASNLQTQLAEAQSEAEEWHNEVEKIRTELEEQIRILKIALENSEAERKICEDKWQKEFEMLRTQHMDREETLMTDCEWQLRQMQRQWKDKLEKSHHDHREAIDSAEMMGLELEARKKEVENLRQYEAEVRSLRGVVTDQHNSIQSLMGQIENLKSDLKDANNKLEDQIEAVRKIKYQCDNALCDKERQMINRIDEVRNEAACFWENKLHTEMTRLTNELESVYVDERRDALDKLQAEHIEELRALTTRYTANEEELRAELTELQERHELKSQDFLELRQKSDNALLQTRMHLDRADREYQNAMCREEERREALEASLRKEFEQEKEAMEAHFRERLEEVKAEFAEELKSSKEEMQQKHKTSLEQQRAKLRAEKDEAMQELAERHRAKLRAAEDQLKELELRHQRDLNELKSTYDEDKAILDKRDMSNTSEIEQLHRRCRCLTNLFEEMRMRYERRDPRQEDLREIEELRTRCDSQERDLFTLTSTLREMQLQMATLEQKGKTVEKKSGGKTIHKPPPKTIPTSCDVIYEENEERDSPPPAPLNSHNDNHIKNNNQKSDSIDDDDEDDDGEESDESDEEPESAKLNGNKMVNGSVSELH